MDLIQGSVKQMKLAQTYQPMLGLGNLETRALGFETKDDLDGGGAI